jgi:acid phosphatase (class A)
MPHLRRRIVLAGFLAAVVPLRPVSAGAPPYITSADVDLTLILPPTTVAATAQDKAEQEAVLAAQRSASVDRIKLANSDNEETVYAMFGALLGPNFTPEKLPNGNIFFTRVTDSEDETVDPAKKYFGRVRPFLANPEIKALVPPTKSGAYPSGHTTRVTMCAIIVASMLPEKRDAIWARAAEYAESRVIGGMHYPDDLEGGRRAGSAMAAVMFSRPDFRADYEVAKAELRAALGM